MKSWPINCLYFKIEIYWKVLYLWFRGGFRGEKSKHCIGHIKTFPPHGIHAQCLQVLPEMLCTQAPWPLSQVVTFGSGLVYISIRYIRKRLHYSGMLGTFSKPDVAHLTKTYPMLSALLHLRLMSFYMVAKGSYSMLIVLLWEHTKSKCDAGNYNLLGGIYQISFYGNLSGNGLWLSY